MLRDYKTFTYEFAFSHQVPVRDFMGEATGRMETQIVADKIAVVAKTRALADAWMENRFNAPYMKHEHFNMNCIDTQPAPHIIWEMPY